MAQSLHLRERQGIAALSPAIAPMKMRAMALSSSRMNTGARAPTPEESENIVPKAGLMIRTPDHRSAAPSDVAYNGR